MATVVSIVNMKGGVGKTTLTAQIAHNCRVNFGRVLAIDLDPQANLSQSLLSHKVYADHLREQRPTVKHLIEGSIPPTAQNGGPRSVAIQDVIIRNLRADFDLIPSQLELSECLKSAEKGWERRLVREIAKVADRYRLVVVDCAPTESMLTEVAYHVSRYVLVPVNPEFLATIGLPLLARSMQSFKSRNSDHSLNVCGIAFNHRTPNPDGPETRTAEREVNRAAADYGWKVYKSEILYSRSYAKAAREGRPIGSTSHVRRKVPENLYEFLNEFERSIREVR